MNKINKNILIEFINKLANHELVSDDDEKQGLIKILKNYLKLNKFKGKGNENEIKVFINEITLKRHKKTIEKNDERLLNQLIQEAKQEEEEMKLKEKQEKINKMKKEVEKLQQQINEEQNEQKLLIAV
jgi:hypothetical protein